MMEIGFLNLPSEALFSAENLKIMILMYLILYGAYCYVYMFHHDNLLRWFKFGSKSISDDESIELSRGSVSFDNTSLDFSLDNISVTDRYHFRTSFGTFLLGDTMTSLQSLLSSWNHTSTPLRRTEKMVAINTSKHDMMFPGGDSWMQKPFFHVEIPEEEVLIPEDDLSTSSGLDFSRKEDGNDTSDEAMRDNGTFKTSLGKILFMTTLPKLDSLELNTNCDGRFQSYLLVEETIITPTEEVRKDFMQSILCELADADILFPHNESLFDSEEALDSQIIASSVDFVSSLQTELAECKSENLLLRQEVDSLTLQLTNARTQLATFEQQAAWKSLENMRLSTSNSKLQKKVDSLKLDVSDKADLNLDPCGIDQTQGELLERLRACEEELALKQDVCYSQGRQLVELRRQLDLNDAAEKAKRSNLQQTVGSMKLLRDGSSSSRLKSDVTRSAVQKQLSPPARIKLFSSSIDEDIVYGAAVSRKDKAFLHDNNLGDTEDGLFVEYPHQQMSETILLKSTPFTSVSSQGRRGSRINMSSSYSANKPMQIKAEEVNDELYMKINELEVALRVRSAEVTTLMCQLSDAEFRREDDSALIAAHARISQLELELMALSPNGFDASNPTQTTIMNGVGNSCERLELAQKSSANADVENDTGSRNTLTVNYLETNNDTDASHVFFRKSSTLLEFESFEVPVEELRQSNNEIEQLQAEIEQLRRELAEHTRLSMDNETLKLQLERVQEMRVSDQQTFEVRETALVSQVQVLESKLEHQWKANDHDISVKIREQEPHNNGSPSQERMQELVAQSIVEASLEMRPFEVDNLLEKGKGDSKLSNGEFVSLNKEFETTAMDDRTRNTQGLQALNSRVQEANHNEGLLRAKILELTSVQATIEASLDGKTTEIEELTSLLQNEQAALKSALVQIFTLEENLRSSEYNSKLLIDELAYVKEEFESMRTEVLTQSVNESSLKHQCQIIGEELLASEEQNRSLRGQLTEVQSEAEELQAKISIISAAHQDLISIELKKLQETVSKQSSVNEELQTRLLEVQRNANESSTKHANAIRELEKNLADNAEMYNLYQQHASGSLQEKQQQLEEKQNEIFALESRVHETEGLLSRITDELNAMRADEGETMKALKATVSELREANQFLSAEKSNMRHELEELHESAQLLQENLRFGSEDVGGRWYAHSFASRIIEEGLHASLSDAEGFIKRLQLQNSELDVKNDNLRVELQTGNEHLLEQRNLVQHYQSKLLQCDQQRLSERESRDRNEVEEVLLYSLTVLENKISAEETRKVYQQLQPGINDENISKDRPLRPLNDRIHQLSEGGKVKEIPEQNSIKEINLLKQRVLRLNEEKEMMVEDHWGRYLVSTESLSQHFESTIQRQSMELERLSAALLFEQSETSLLSESLKRLEAEFNEFTFESRRFVSSLQQELSPPSQSRDADTAAESSLNAEELKAAKEMCLLSVREHSALLESTRINSLKLLAEQAEKVARLESTISDQTEKIAILETTCDHIQRLRDEEKEKLSAQQLQTTNDYIQREAELDATYRAQLKQISEMEIVHESNLQVIHSKSEKIAALEFARGDDLQTIKDLREKTATLEETAFNNQRIINDLGFEINKQLEGFKALVVSKESDIRSYQLAAMNSAMLLQELWEIINAFMKQNPCISLLSSLSTGTLEDLNPLDLLEIDSVPHNRGPLTLAGDDEDSNSKEIWELKAEKEISEHHSQYDNYGTHETTEQELLSEASKQKPLNGHNSISSGSNLVGDSNSVMSPSATISGLPCSIADIRSLAEQLHNINQVIRIHHVERNSIPNQLHERQREEEKNDNDDDVVFSGLLSFSKQWNHSSEAIMSDKAAVIPFLECISMRISDLESKEHEKTRVQPIGSDVNKILRKSIDVLRGELDGVKMSLAAKVDELHYVFQKLGQVREKIAGAMDDDEVDNFPQVGCPGVDAPDNQFIDRLSQIVDDMQKFRGEALSLRETDREKDRQINSLIEIVASQLSDFSTIEAVLQTWETCVGKSLGLEDCQHTASTERISAFTNDSQRAVSGLTWLTEGKPDTLKKWIGEDSLRLLDEMQRFFLENTQVVSSWRKTAVPALPSGQSECPSDFKSSETINSKSTEQLKSDSSLASCSVELEPEDSIVKKRRESLNALEKQILDYQSEMANLARLQRRCEKEKETLLLQLDVTKSIRKKQLKIKSSRQGLLHLNLSDDSVISNSFK